ncbi:MAG: DUF4065 domain-containing protein [Sphaerochaeta sp.]|nr:DUF4065 domain-containing protein [Sphaerochaeta sp.]
MKATDVAKYVIDICYKNNIQISNLKLQKTLFFLWIDFYLETKKSLFDDKIYAWPLGPVIPSIYREYCAYGSLPILPFGNEGSELLPITEEETKLLDTLIKKYASMSAYNLVEKSHEGGSSWATTFRDGLGNKFEIPFALIKQLGK